MHEDEIDIDVDLVRKLVAAQFPQWSALPITRARSTGTVNAIFRLGDDLSVRLPRTPRMQDWDVDCWLTALGGRLSIPIPEPVGAGQPDQIYPWRWSVHRWVDGEPWRASEMAESCKAAEQLAEFIARLHELEHADMPCQALWDGGRFASSDQGVRASAPKARGIDTEALLSAWDRALDARPWQENRVLIHWDLLPGNVLYRDGRISGVIDWGALAVGDPARDLLPTWTLFSGDARRGFRSMIGCDEDTWARARGWALAFVVGVAYYERTNPTFAAECRTTVGAVLQDRD